MIKAVFFDVDHTLFSHRLNAIPESAKKAIQILQKKGIYVFLATGRHRIEIEQLPMEEITFDGYITLSGQLCLDKNYRILYENSIHPHDIEILRNEFEKKEIPVFFIEKMHFTPINTPKSWRKYKPVFLLKCLLLENYPIIKYIR